MKLYKSFVIAQLLDLSERRIRQLRDEGVLKEFRPGLYQLVPTINSYINYLRNQIKGDGTATLAEEKARLLKVKRENGELDLAIKKEEYHKGEDVELLVGTMLMNFRSRLLGIPSKMASTFDGSQSKNDINDMASGFINEALEELSDYNKLFKDGGVDGEENTETSKETS